MSKAFPEGLKYGIRYDTTLFVREAISKVYETLFIAAVLVLIVVLLFLQNFRAMLVPATTVPVTIIGAFIAMAALGFTVNLMTLFALILAIGIVVDDAIVVVEGASYHIERGMTPRERHDQGNAGIDGPDHGNHACPGFGFPAGRVFPWHKRADISPVCARYCCNIRNKRHQRPYPQTRPVRFLVEAAQQRAAQFHLPRVQQAFSMDDRRLHGAGCQHGETACHRC